MRTKWIKQRFRLCGSMPIHTNRQTKAIVSIVDPSSLDLIMAKIIVRRTQRHCFRRLDDSPVPVGDNAREGTILCSMLIFEFVYFWDSCTNTSGVSIYCVARHILILFMNTKHYLSVQYLCRHSLSRCYLHKVQCYDNRTLPTKV